MKGGSETEEIKKNTQLDQRTSPERIPLSVSVSHTHKQRTGRGKCCRKGDTRQEEKVVISGARSRTALWENNLNNPTKAFQMEQKY